MSEFDNINGIYAKDATLRAGITALRDTVVGQTIKPLTVTSNDTYTANPAEGTYGYSPVTVDVVEQPWEPLEDGYSNFWFELTNDTLSPWLNFSAIDNDAVIDWGDGSGEVALDTLTPTHTYSKAGRYVVKVKGVTGIARQNTTPYNAAYLDILRYVELNNEVTALSNSAFIMCVKLKSYVGESVTSIGNNAFYFCSSLESLNLDGVTSFGNANARFCENLKSLSLASAVTIGSNSIQYCVALSTLALPSTVTSISSATINTCLSLSEIHVQATTPPTLGNNNFVDIASTYIIYVPVGTGDTYKAAAGWSAYADHIVEEGSRMTASQLRKIQSESTEEMR